MLATTASFLATVAAQVGSAFYNNSKGKAHGIEMARKQLAFEEKVAREGIENARAEFAELCSFQRELEAEIQRDRLKLLSESFQTSLTLEAYELSLNSWPLLVPPYVITSNSVFSLENSENKAIPLNCILTPSTDGNFNNNIHVKIEENLADFFSKYWNLSFNKSIRFLQETWRESFSDADTKRQNLYAHLKSVPTLVISPIIRDEKLIFRIYWWGLSPDANEVHIDGSDEFDPAISISVTRAKKYAKEEISEITEQCTAKLSAFISYFADLYYWNFYKEAPSLPYLISQGFITIGLEDKSQYFSTLSNVFVNSLSQKNTIFDPNDRWMSFISTFSNVNDFVAVTTNYIKSIPDCRVSSYGSLISKMKLIPNLSNDSIIELNEISNRIYQVVDRIRQHNVTWKVIKNDYLSVLDVIRTCEKAQLLLPECDTFNILKRDDKLAAIAFFTHHGEVVSWDDCGIWVFLSPQFLAPVDLFNKDRFSCDVNSLKLYYEIINKNMNKEDVMAIIDAQYEQLKQELLPAASKIDDIFSTFVSSLKETIAKEQVSKEVETFDRKELKYEDIVKWLRSAKVAVGNIPFNGAFLTKGKGGFFDKYTFKMYVCLTNDKQPLTDENHPKVIISYNKTDDTLDDMFGKNDCVQLNFK